MPDSNLLKANSRMTPETGNGSKISVRKPVAVFLVCLLMASSLWFSIRVSEYYHAGINVKLGFRNIPVGKVMIEPVDSLVSINLHAQGFKLLSLSLFHKAPKLIIDISQLDLQWRKGESHSFFILSKLAPEVMQKLNLTDEFESFTPDTIHFVFRNMAFKKVPVRAKLLLEFEKGYQLSGNLKYDPDSVIVSAMSSDLDEINYVETEEMKIKDLNESKTVSLNLIRPDFKHVQLSHGEVNIEIPVAEKPFAAMKSLKTSVKKRGKRK